MQQIGSEKVREGLQILRYHNQEIFFTVYGQNHWLKNVYIDCKALETNEGPIVVFFEHFYLFSFIRLAPGDQTSELIFKLFLNIASPKCIGRPIDFTSINSEMTLNLHGLTADKQIAFFIKEIQFFAQLQSTRPL